MKRFLTLFCVLILMCGYRANGYRDLQEAEFVITDTEEFDGNLSDADDTVQKALETLDELSAGSGTVTSVSVVTANGLAGSVATATTTPAITLSTSITGVLKGNGTAISAAVADTDYQVPLTFGDGLTRTDNDVDVDTTQNIAVLSNLTSNGFVKTSGGTGTLSVDTSAYQGSDSTLTALAAYNTNGLLTQTSADTFTGRTITGTASQISVADGDGVSGNPTLSLDSDIPTVAITYVIDGGGSVITTGVKGYLEIPFAMTITGWTITADQSGSIVVDVWKDTYANYPPTVADTIAGSEKPTISSSTKGQDLSLSSWTTSVTAGDILGFNVDSITTVTRVTVTIRGTKA